MASYDEKDIKIAKLEEQVKQLEEISLYFRELSEKLINKYIETND